MQHIWFFQTDGVGHKPRSSDGLCKLESKETDFPLEHQKNQCSPANADFCPETCVRNLTYRTVR